MSKPRDDADMLERVARAIHDAAFEERFDDELPNGIARAMAIQQAKAAIAAMAEVLLEHD